VADCDAYVGPAKSRDSHPSHGEYKVAVVGFVEVFEDGLFALGIPMQDRLPEVLVNVILFRAEISVLAYHCVARIFYFKNSRDPFPQFFSLH
jgi:hypothetical protein